MVIEVVPGKDSKSNPIEPFAQGGGRIKLELGDYIVSAQLDSSQPACLEACSRDDRCVLVSGQPTRSIALGGDSHPVTCEGSTILWEKQTGAKDIFVETIDQLPDVLLYGNRY